MRASTNTFPGGVTIYIQYNILAVDLIISSHFTMNHSSVVVVVVAVAAAARQVIGYGLLFLLTVSLVAGSDAGNMSKEHFSWQFRLAARFRTPILVFVVVPLSFLLRTYRSIRTTYYFYMNRALLVSNSKNKSRDDRISHAHAARVQQVVDQIKAWDSYNHNNKENQPQKLRTARPNWAQMSLKLGSNKEEGGKGSRDASQSQHKIQTSHLHHILSICPEKMTITCEPSVTMGDITATLLPHQLALLCQVEMESLTIGGLSMGLGMETNSHTVGWFQETVVEFEIVTVSMNTTTTENGTGAHTGAARVQVQKVTRESDPDLFYALPHSLGTLGFLVSVTVKMTRTKPYVRMHYIMTKSAQELTETMTKLAEGRDAKAPQFLEATCYSKHTAVVQCGEMVDEPTTREDKKLINYINRWYKPFYFKHLQQLLEQACNGHGGQHNANTYDEIIPLKHYYHRFTRSIFWEIEYMIPFSNHPLYRFFWGWMGAPEVSLLKLFQGPVIRRNSVYAHVIQESCFPVRKLAEGLDKFEEWWDIYPLLVFPLRTYDRGIHSGFLNPKGKNLCPKADGSIGTENWGIWVDLVCTV